MNNKFENKSVRGLAKLGLVALMSAALMPVIAAADTADEIKAMIMQDNADVRKNLADGDGGISTHGSLEFWSSGGLMQHIPADSPAGTYEQYSLTPKHI